MKLFKDGTLFIPPRALQYFSFVLGGVGGRVRDHVSSPKDGTFQIPTRKRECAKIKTKRRFFQTTLEFPFLNKRLWTGGLQTVLREMMGPLQTMY
jgi:hypothetical protein